MAFRFRFGIYDFNLNSYIRCDNVRRLAFYYLVAYHTYSLQVLHVRLPYKIDLRLYSLIAYRFSLSFYPRRALIQVFFATYNALCHSPYINIPFTFSLGILYSNPKGISKPQTIAWGLTYLYAVNISACFFAFCSARFAACLALRSSRTSSTVLICDLLNISHIVRSNCLRKVFSLIGNHA